MGLSITAMSKRVSKAETEATMVPAWLTWSQCRGIYLRLTKTEATWYWRGTLRKPGLQGEPFRMWIGDWTDNKVTADFLRDKADELRKMCKEGRDPRLPAPAPVVEEKPEALTMKQQWDKYLSLKKNIAESYRKDIDNKWGRSCTVLHNLTPDQVTVPLISEMFDNYIDDDLISTAHHIRRVVRPFFAWVRRRNPALPADLLVDLELPKEKPNQDYLRTEEIISFGRALREHGYRRNGKDRDYIQKYNVAFLLMTGCRAGVLTHWNSTWDKGDHLFIPINTPGLKNPDHDLIILITPPARKLIPKLVPCTNSSLRNCIRLLCRDAKIGRMLSPHRMRATYTTEGGNFDPAIPGEVLDTLTSHQSKSQMQRIYNKADLLKRMPIALKVADHLAELLGLQNMLSGMPSTEITIAPSLQPEKEISGERNEVTSQVRSSGLEKAVKVTAETIENPFGDFSND